MIVRKHAVFMLSAYLPFDKRICVEDIAYYQQAMPSVDSDSASLQATAQSLL
jgi:hypothetical protein